MGTAARAPHIPFVGATAHLLGDHRQLLERSGCGAGSEAQEARPGTVAPSPAACTHSQCIQRLHPPAQILGRSHTGLFTRGSTLVIRGRLSLEPVELLLGSSAPFLESAGFYEAPWVPSMCCLAATSLGIGSSMARDTITLTSSLGCSQLGRSS